ncbi:hypothetical protein BC833DRAFT_335778 [Globomyces pollinis-pini]|nr:hypothetical protein BC833DRAFT_335778 [Globomyces pollinis-pini]
MKEKIDNLSKENSQQLASLEKSNLEIQSLQAAKLENENVNDKERLAMEKLVGELQQIIDGKEIEIRDLKMKLSELEVATAGDKSNIIKLEEKIQKLMDDNKKQLAKLSAKESEFEKLRIPQNEIPGVHNTQEQLQEKEKLITRLNIDIEKLEHEKKDLLEKSNSNKHEVERLEAELELAKPNHEAGDKDDSGRDAYEAELLNTIKLKDMEIEELENQLDNATLSLEQLHSECETLRVDRVTDADFKLLEEDLEWTKKQLELAEEALEKEKKRKGSVQKSVSFAPSVPSTLEAPLRTTSLHRLHSSLPEGIEALKADQTNMTELEKKYYDACFSLQAYNVQLKYKIEMLETQIEEMVDGGYEDSDGDYTDSEGEEEGKETPKDTTSIPTNNKSDEPLQRTSTGIFGLW